MEHSKEFIKAQKDYLEAYQNCFTEFTYSRCNEPSWKYYQDKFRETLTYMQSFKEEKDFINSLLPQAWLCEKAMLEKLWIE